MARGNGETVLEVEVGGTVFKRGRKRPAGFAFGPPRFVADNADLYRLSEELRAKLLSFYGGDAEQAAARGFYPAVVTSQAELDAALALEKAMPICMSTDVDLRFQIRPVVRGAEEKTVFVGGACEADCYDNMKACALDISEVALHRAHGEAIHTGCLHVYDGSRAILRERALIERSSGSIEIELHDQSTAIVESGGACVLAYGQSSVLAERASLVCLYENAQLQPTSIRGDDGQPRASRVRKVVMRGCGRLGPLEKATVEIAEPWVFLEQVGHGVRFTPSWQQLPGAELVVGAARRLARDGQLPHAGELPVRPVCVYCRRQVRTPVAEQLSYRFGICVGCQRRLDSSQQ